MANYNRKHGMTGTPTHNVWKGIRQRVKPNNPKAHLYHDKGITVCDRWQVFLNFLEDMGEKPEGLTIDRINPDLGYSKENCRWATLSEQARNTGSSKGSSSRYKGVSRPAHTPSFIAQIYIDGKQKYLGSYKTEDEAALAYNKEAQQHAGFRLNEVKS
jgi:hypothetical protein